MRTIRTLVAALGVLISVAACGAAGEPAAAPTTAAAATASASASPSASPRVPAVPGPGDQEIVLQWEGRERTAKVHAPEGYKAGMPLVIGFHYFRGDTEVFRKMTRLDEKADQKGFIVVYPVGVIRGFNALECCGSADDVGFTKALITHMIEKWKVDRRRVFVTGISNGADMSFRLAVEAPGMIAAIAPVSGGFIGGKAADPAFKARTPVSVVTFIGLADRASTFNEGLGHWRTKEGCKIVARGHYDAAKQIAWNRARCADGSEVVDYQITGMGHVWPGGTDAGLGSPTQKINAVDVMWDFFAAHPLRT